LQAIRCVTQCNCLLAFHARKRFFYLLQGSVEFIEILLRLISDNLFDIVHLIALQRS
jgi:hypothetical protein